MIDSISNVFFYNLICGLEFTGLYYLLMNRLNLAFIPTWLITSSIGTVQTLIVLHIGR